MRRIQKIVRDRAAKWMWLARRFGVRLTRREAVLLAQTFPKR